jgi:hypothetical protein
MGGSADFRASRYDAGRVDKSGKSVGSRYYWKLYASENLLRVIVNSVLTAQIGKTWWSGVDPKIQKKAEDFRKRYKQKPWHTSPGGHGIYYTQLRDLNEILRSNSHLFLPIIPDVDQWIARIEQIRLPRNIVCHMNFPSVIDGKRMDVFYADVRELAAKLLADGLKMMVP